MTKKRTRTENPFDLYEFDFTAKVAYRFPEEWTSKQKMAFARLPAEAKRERCIDGGGFYIYNREELRIHLIPSNIFSRADQEKRPLGGTPGEQPDRK